jgi:hypothetical protein
MRLATLHQSIGQTTMMCDVSSVHILVDVYRFLQIFSLVGMKNVLELCVKSFEYLIIVEFIDFNFSKLKFIIFYRYFVTKE